MESSDITKYIMEFVWPLIKEESGTAIIWTLIGGGLGLLISIFLIIFLWGFLKNRKFLGGKTGPKWPKYLLLVSWIILLPLSCVTSGGAWGFTTAAQKIVTNQKAIEETVSLALETPLNQGLTKIIESPEIPDQQKALLLKQQDDEITLSTWELDKWLIQMEDIIYETIKEHSFLSSIDNKHPMVKDIERWVIDSVLEKNNPASLNQEIRAAVKHAEENFGTHVTAKQLGYSIGGVIVKPHIDEAVKAFKTSIIITGVIQIASIILISVAIAALLDFLIKRLQKTLQTPQE